MFLVSDGCRLDRFLPSRLSGQSRRFADWCRTGDRQSRAMGILASKRLVGWTPSLDGTVDLAPLPLRIHCLHHSTGVEIAKAQEFSTKRPTPFPGTRSALSKSLPGDEGPTMRFDPDLWVAFSGYGLLVAAVCVTANRVGSFPGRQRTR